MTNDLKEKMFRYYAYGYLNSKIIRENRFGRNERYKEAKIQMTIDYLKIDGYSRIIQNFIIVFLRVLELPMTIVSLCQVFINYLLCKIFTPKRSITIENRVCFFTKESKMDTLLKNLKKQNDDFLMIVYPFEKLEKNLSQIPCYKIINSLSFHDIWTVFICSIQYCCFFYSKYKKNDFLFRIFSCYDFFVTILFIEKLEKNNTLLCTETFSRWAFILKDSMHKKIFLQHGMLGDGICFLKKVGTPEIGYYINEEQINNCNFALFTNNPVAYIMDGLKFTSDNKLIKNGKKNLLIVCRHSDFEKEEQLSRMVVETGKYNLYLKPHPLSSYDKYESLSRELGFIVLDRGDYPHVDVVISYKSTLALEYAGAGVAVIRHDQYDNNKIYEMLDNEKYE